MNERQVGPEAVARLAGVTTKSVYDWLKGYGPMRPTDTRARIEGHLSQAPGPIGAHFTYVGSAQAAKALDEQVYRAVPILSDRVAAGPPRVINAEDIEGYLFIYQEWAKVRDSYCLRIQGNSMLPQFRDGDLVGVSLWRGKPRDLANLFVAVWLPDEGVTVKTLKLSSDGKIAILYALNPAAPDYPRVLSHEQADGAQWWRVDWWWGHQP